MTELKELIRQALNRHTDLLKDDEYTKHSIYDEISNYLVNALQMLDKLDTLKDTKYTREILYLKSKYARCEEEDRLFLDVNFAHSIHEIDEHHIYEVTVKRTTSTNVSDLSIDYIHTATVIVDFDYNNCPYEDYKKDFVEALSYSLIDVRFDAVDIAIKQLS